MPGKLKLIGVCLSHAYSEINAGYIRELNRAAGREGYRVVVFNSSLDFYWYKQGNHVARSIYSAIDYDSFSALVVVHESFHDQQLLERIVREAAESHVPVLCLGAVQEGCVSVLYDYYQPYKDLLRHVIEQHGVRDPFYISGMENEPNSVLRLQCFREVLQETGLPRNPENEAYGLYYDEPAKKIAERLIETRERMPDAIFCANDAMALAVCDTLKEHGFQVPRDIRVTGFDGIPLASLVSPRLATCSQDAPALAELTVRLIQALDRGEKVDPVQHHAYLSVPDESCGCSSQEAAPPDALTLYRRIEKLNSHENHLYLAVERMLMQENMRDLLVMLAQTIPQDSAVYLNKSFLSGEQGSEYDQENLEEDLLCIPHAEMLAADVPLRDIHRKDLCREFEDRPGITVLTAIHSEKTVCGCFAVHTDSLDDSAQIIKRLSDVLNLTFSVMLGNVRQKRLLTHLENSLYLDPMTGLSNLKGLNRWFDGYSAEESGHGRCVALSVYQIHRYDYLYETYGISETEEIVRLVSRYLKEANPEALHLARINEKQFVVVNDAEKMEEISRIITCSVDAFYRRIEQYNADSGKSFFLEVNCGCTTMEKGWESAALGNLIRLATGEMYLNRMRSVSHEAEKGRISRDAGRYRTFRLLLEKNLFRYHFQPIVDARTGQIFAYEALMRTDPAIQMSPLEILEIAREYNHLDDVERRTLFGIMERYTKDYSSFHSSKVFINTIPGHFLSREECDKLRARFENYLDCFVFELTEQDATTDEELERLKRFHRIGGQTQVAIDDYGTGHSNIVNLLRYAPQIIKIDRELIAGIQSDSNKQLFVRNTIEFAHQNGIKALAEGVETAEELRCVIGCGVDLLQGFYLARPAEQPLDAIPESIRDEILEEKLRRISQDSTLRVYHARDGETLHLIELALHHYTLILLPPGEITLIGVATHTVDMLLQVEDGARTRLNLDHVSLRGSTGTTVQLGEGSRVLLNLTGENVLHKEGILVPVTAKLRIAGSGSLEIRNDRNYAVGIGANYNDPYGSVEIDMEGDLRFRASGDKVICLGGGRSVGEGIRIRRGNIHLQGSGISILGIGSTNGSAFVEMGADARLEAHLQANDAVALGTISGPAELRLAGEISATVESERAAVIGTMNGSTDILLETGQVSAVARCGTGACLGSFTGEASLELRDADVRIHGEGNCVCGLGSLEGSGETRISGGFLAATLLAGTRKMLGSERNRCMISGGNIRLSEVSGPRPTGPHGEKLRYTEPEEDHFCRTFGKGENSWTYRADRNESGELGVWIPEE